MGSIAVVMATYNGEKYIEQQLSSIVCQTKKPDKIYISDDNSTDHTVDLAKKCLVKNQAAYAIKVNEICNKGVNNNFQSALEMASEDIIFIADQDDIWSPTKIEKMSLCLQDDCGLVLCNARYMVNGKKINQNIFEKNRFYPKVNANHMTDKEVYIKECIKRPVASGMSIAVSKKILQSAIPFCKSMYYDEWINWVAMAMGKIYILNECLIEYRQHDANVVGGKKKYNRSMVKKKVQHDVDYIRNELNRINEIRDLDRRNPFLSKENMEFLLCNEDFLNTRLQAVMGRDFLLYAKVLCRYIKDKDKKNIYYRRQDIIKDGLAAVHFDSWG